jgi:hypothetical protein
LSIGASRLPSVCLAISALTASLGSVTDTVNCNWDCTYVNEFHVAVEDPDVGIPKTIAQEAIGLTMGHNFSTKVFWDSNSEWFS